MSSRTNRKLPLWLLILAAVIGGVLFYVSDNQPQRGATIPADAAIVNTVDAQATIAPTMVAVDDAQSADEITSADDAQAQRPSIISQNTTLFIPSAGVASRVIETYLDGQTWDVSQLGSNVGHLQGTPWIEQGVRGNVVLSGHVELSNGRRGVFANLEELKVNDLVRLTVNGEQFDYFVTEIRTTTPDDLTPVMPTSSHRLTLITCDSYSFTADSYLERMIIVAEPAGAA